MNRKVKALLAACGIVAASHAAAQLTLYEGEGYRGRTFSTNDRVRNLDRAGFNDRASSVVVERGRWEVCEDARFEGRCVVLRRGSYPSLRDMGMNNAISSVRRAEPGRSYGYEAPPPVAVVPRGEAPRPLYGPTAAAAPRPAYHEVPVASVRAVMGPPSQRCWVEREQVAQPYRGEPNLGGAVLGGIIGGVLGHQVGGGSGKDLATAGGVVAGAAIGANVNRSGNTGYAQRDVQRCQNVSSSQPAYWNVSYFHGGIEHRVQMASAPGNTLLVDEAGAPVTATR